MSKNKHKEIEELLWSLENVKSKDKNMITLVIGNNGINYYKKYMQNKIDELLGDSNFTQNIPLLESLTMVLNQLKSWEPHTDKLKNGLVICCGFIDLGEHDHKLQISFEPSVVVLDSFHIDTKFYLSNLK